MSEPDIVPLPVAPVPGLRRGDQRKPLIGREREAPVTSGRPWLLSWFVSLCCTVRRKARRRGDEEDDEALRPGEALIGFLRERGVCLCVKGKGRGFRVYA